MLVGADRFRGAVDDSAEQLCVSGVRLARNAPPDVAAPGDEAQGDEDEEDGGEASAEAGPVEVDKGEPIVGLIQVDVRRLMVDLVGNGEIGLVVEEEGLV